MKEIMYNIMVHLINQFLRKIPKDKQFNIERVMI